MCGIAGIFNCDGAPVDARVLERMTTRIAHRGPDGEGWFVDGSVGLGNRRLAIIDLSDAAAQPMRNEDGDVVLTWNGELYNFRDLRPELEESGHCFRSASDTEVVVHAYEEWGLDFLARLRACTRSRSGTGASAASSSRATASASSRCTGPDAATRSCSAPK